MTTRQHIDRIGDDLLRDLAEAPRVAHRTGFPSLDVVTNGGLREGDVSVIAAFSGYGKTSLVEQMCLDMSIDTDIVLMPLELGYRDTRIRLGAKVARCSISSIERSGLDAITQSELNARKLKLRVPPKREKPSIDRIAGVIAREAPKVVAIDYMRYVEGWFRDGHKGAIDIVQRCKDIALERSVHVICCAQINPEDNGKPSSRWRIQDCPELYHVASLVVMIDRPFYGRRDDDISLLVVRKNRYGKPTTVPYRWVGESQSFFEYDPESRKTALERVAKRRRNSKEEPIDDRFACDRIALGSGVGRVVSPTVRPRRGAQVGARGD